MKKNKTDFFAAPPFAPEWTRENAFQKAFSLRGKVFREIKNRRTLRFEYEGESYFIKIHRGVGWREIIKNLLQFKKPVLGAQNEFYAIRLLEKLKIETMRIFAYAVRGKNPAEMESFLITGELKNKVTLEDLARNWKTFPPDPKIKRNLIEAVAKICSAMHFAGMNHRDCYICHFMADTAALTEGKVKLCVLDLHRAEIRKKIPERMRVKDLAGIFFSSMDAGLSKRDALRFMAVYARGGKLPRNTWKRVWNTAIALYRKEFGRLPEL